MAFDVMDGERPEYGVYVANTNMRFAREFHNLTKYTLVNEGQPDETILMGTPPNLKPAIGEQSPSNEPHPFKVYTELDALALPSAFLAFTLPVLDAIASSGEALNGPLIPDRAALARLCLLSNGILKRGSHETGRVIEYRAAGGTEARYHLELYIVCGDLPDLDAGVYQYSASDHSLRQLRSGDYRCALAERTGSEAAVVAAPAVLVATSTFWRNAWRYQERAYRHVFWDLGTTLANVLAVAASSDPDKSSFAHKSRATPNRIAAFRIASPITSFGVAPSPNPGRVTRTPEGPRCRRMAARCTGAAEIQVSSMSWTSRRGRRSPRSR